MAARGGRAWRGCSPEDIYAPPGRRFTRCTAPLRRRVPPRRQFRRRRRRSRQRLFSMTPAVRDRDMLGRAPHNRNNAGSQPPSSGNACFSRLCLPQRALRPSLPPPSLNSTAAAEVIVTQDEGSRSFCRRRQAPPRRPRHVQDAFLLLFLLLVFHAARYTESEVAACRAPPPVSVEHRAAEYVRTADLNSAVKEEEEQPRIFDALHYAMERTRPTVAMSVFLR